MMKIFAIKKSTWIAFFVSILASFLMAAVTHAQSNEEQIAAKYQVKFPVAELGNCATVAECRNFCEDPVNQTACTDFAKKKGFYKEPEVNTSKKDEIIAAAKKELGCDSESSCRSFCSDTANFNKCAAFAKSNGISGGQVEDTAKKEILEKAKETLGCNSADSCQSFCSKEENRPKCSDFAKAAGMRGGEQRVGPGGCTSEETCKAFCSDPQNFQVCRGFSESAGRQFSGPGGCTSEESCRSFCKDNEEKCRNFGKGSGERERYNPQEMCSRTPNCRWEENTCRCGNYEGGRREEGKSQEEYAKFCRENPQRCGASGKDNLSSESQEAACRRGGCNWLGNNRCECPANGGTYAGSRATYTGGSTADPATGCRNAGGSWNGNYCQMPVNNTTPSNPTQNTAPSGMSRDSQESACRSCGGSCNWNGDTCRCECAGSGSGGGTPQQTQPTPQPEQQSQPAPQPEQQSQPAPVAPAPAPPATEPAPSPAVQGIAAMRNIFDRILDIFR